MRAGRSAGGIPGLAWWRVSPREAHLQSFGARREASEPQGSEKEERGLFGDMSGVIQFDEPLVCPASQQTTRWLPRGELLHPFFPTGGSQEGATQGPPSKLHPVGGSMGELSVLVPLGYCLVQVVALKGTHKGTLPPLETSRPPHLLFQEHPRTPVLPRTPVSADPQVYVSAFCFFFMQTR